jgi:pimeloyl-ACP methyl ester carboxylesterase
MVHLFYKLLQERMILMQTVTSKDGTTIAYDQTGSGTPLILVGGAMSTRTGEELSKYLAPHFTVITYDRRGRGDSTNTLPYAVQREIEDIEALVDAAGGSAYLYGMSSGAVLALEAANALPNKIKKLVMYEPPLIVDDSRPPAPADYVQQLQAAAGQPGRAVEIFMTKALLIPEEYVEQMKVAPPTEGYDPEMRPPAWESMVVVEHTLAYDGMVMDKLMLGNPLPRNRWSSAALPALVIAGGNSEPFFHSGAKALADLLPNTQYRVLEGQDHAVAPSALAPVLIEFYKN